MEGGRENLNKGSMEEQTNIKIWYMKNKMKEESLKEEWKKNEKIMGDGYQKKKKI